MIWSFKSFIRLTGSYQLKIKKTDNKGQMKWVDDCSLQCVMILPLAVGTNQCKTN